MNTVHLQAKLGTEKPPPHHTTLQEGVWDTLNKEASNLLAYSLEIRMWFPFCIPCFITEDMVLKTGNLLWLVMFKVLAFRFVVLRFHTSAGSFPPSSPAPQPQLQSEDIQRIQAAAENAGLGPHLCFTPFTSIWIWQSHAYQLDQQIVSYLCCGAELGQKSILPACVLLFNPA